MDLSNLIAKANSTAPLIKNTAVTKTTSKTITSIPTKYKNKIRDNKQYVDCYFTISARELWKYTQSIIVRNETIYEIINNAVFKGLEFKRKALFIYFEEKIELQVLLKGDNRIAIRIYDEHENQVFFHENHIDSGEAETDSNDEDED